MAERVPLGQRLGAPLIGGAALFLIAGLGLLLPVPRNPDATLSPATPNAPELQSRSDR